MVLSTSRLAFTLAKPPKLIQGLYSLLKIMIDKRLYFK